MKLSDQALETVSQVLIRFSWTGKGIPHLRVDVVFLKEAEGTFVLTPEGEVFDSMLAILQDLLFKLGHVSGPPVVGAPTKPESIKHGRPLSGTTLRRVKGNHTPCDQVLSP